MSYANDIPSHRQGDRCPACDYGNIPKGGKLHLVKTGNGKQVFLGCSRYPDCKYMISPYYTLENEQFQIEQEQKDQEREE